MFEALKISSLLTHLETYNLLGGNTSFNVEPRAVNPRRTWLVGNLV